MEKVKSLIPVFNIGGADSYPVGMESVSIIDQVNFAGVDYFIVMHDAGLNLEAGAHTYSDYEAATALREVIIDTVTGSLTGFDDAPNEFTVPEGVDVIARGKLAIPDQKFRVPFERVDTGRVQPMVAEVVNGEFTLTMNFRTGGKWVVNDNLLNSELPTPMFSIKQHTFMVV